MKKGSRKVIIKRYDAEIACNLRKARLRAGATQNDIAVFLGVSFQQVQKYETGSNRISAGKLYALAEFLGVNINYFYEGLDKKTSKSICITERDMKCLADMEKLYFSIKDEKRRTHCLDIIAVLAKQDQLAHTMEMEAS